MWFPILGALRHQRQKVHFSGVVASVSLGNSSYCCWCVIGQKSLFILRRWPTFPEIFSESKIRYIYVAWPAPRRNVRQDTDCFMSSLRYVHVGIETVNRTCGDKPGKLSYPREGIFWWIFILSWELVVCSCRWSRGLKKVLHLAKSQGQRGRLNHLWP